MPTFDDDSIRRIMDAVKYVEQQYRNQASRDRRSGAVSGKRYAYTTSLISARTGTGPNFTLGKGTATLLFTSYSSSDVGTTAATSYADVTLYSGATGTIASGKLIQVCQLDGKWHVDVDYCV